MLLFGMILSLKMSGLGCFDSTLTPSIATCISIVHICLCLLITIKWLTHLIERSCVILMIAEQLVDKIFASIPRARPDAMLAQDALIIAHRGAHANNQGIIENTHEAFQLAKELGCWGIEFDVHTTADGVFVVNHDATLKRLWNQNVAIADLSFSELRRLVPDIPSLAEVVVQYSPSLHLFIELKVAVHDERSLLDTLSPCVAVSDYHLLTLDASFFSSLTQCVKQALLLVAVHNNVNAFCDLSLAQQYGGVLGNYLLLTDRQRRRLAAANQHSGVGFVDSKNSLYRELNRKIAWIFTNEAVLISQYLKALR